MTETNSISGTIESWLSILKECKGIFLKRKWFIIVSIFSCIIVAYVGFSVFPKLYRSTTLIIVESQKIPESYVQGVVSSNASERVGIIKRQVIGRDILTGIIESFKLYPDMVPGDRLHKVRKNIQVDYEVPKRRSRVQSFSISFAHEVPEMAKKVTEELSSKFIEENQKIRDRYVEDATEFLDQELKLAEKALEEKEEEISLYSNRYLGELPTQLEANLRALDRLQNQLNATEDLLPKLSEQLTVVERAISDYELRIKNSPDSIDIISPKDPRLNKLSKLETQLNRLTLLYRDNYPDVIHLRMEVRLLKEEIAKQPFVGIPEGQTKTNSGSLVQNEDRYLLGLKESRRKLIFDINSAEVRKKKHISNIKSYERRVERVPKHEQALLTLQRDYANMQRNYQSLLSKKVSARIAGNLERRQKAEQFRILETASLPIDPEGLLLWQILLAGLGAGCFVGFGGAYVLENTRSIIRHIEDLELNFHLPVLACIPSFEALYNGSVKGGRLSASPYPSRGSQVFSNRLLAMREEKPRTNGSKKGNTLVRRLKNCFANEELDLPVASNVNKFSEMYNLVSMWKPHSIVAEQYRVAASRVVLNGGNQSNRIFAISSAVKGEGKTTTTGNLGCTLARDLGKRTLIVDCDFSCPKIHSSFGIPIEPGVSNILKEEIGIEESLMKIGEMPLWVLPSGLLGEGVSKLALAHKLSKLLEEVRPHYDYILLDSPPILPLADMNVLADLSDLLILVVRSGLTDTSALTRALNVLRKDPAEVPVVLNDVPSEDIPYYYGSEYDTSVTVQKLT